MNIKNSGYFKKCIQYLQNKKLARIFKSNDHALIQKNFDTLTASYQKDFYGKILYPELADSIDNLMTLANTSFQQALLVFSNEIKLNIIKPASIYYEDYLLNLFKKTYHTNLSHQYLISDDPNAFANLLLELDSKYRDRIIWYYLDKFKLRQICNITGNDIESEKKELWNSRELLRIKLNNTPGFKTTAEINEQQFFFLLNYFEGDNMCESETAFLKFFNTGNIQLQQNFLLELWLIYGISKDHVLKKLMMASNKSIIPADEFMSLLKYNIEYHSPQKNSRLK